MEAKPTVVSQVVAAASAKINAKAGKEGLGELERELIRRSVNCSRTQLSNALKGVTDSLTSEVLLECIEIGWDGDWNKARRVLRK